MNNRLRGYIKMGSLIEPINKCGLLRMDPVLLGLQVII